MNGGWESRGGTMACTCPSASFAASRLEPRARTTANILCLRPNAATAPRESSPTPQAARRAKQRAGKQSQCPKRGGNKRDMERAPGQRSPAAIRIPSGHTKVPARSATASRGTRIAGANARGAVEGAEGADPQRENSQPWWAKSGKWRGRGTGEGLLSVSKSEISGGWYVSRCREDL